MKETKTLVKLVRIDDTTLKALETLIERWRRDEPGIRSSSAIRRAIVYTERATRPAAEKE